MTKLQLTSAIHRRVGSIFRGNKKSSNKSKDRKEKTGTGTVHHDHDHDNTVAKDKDSFLLSSQDLDSEDETVKLEESESELLALALSSSSTTSTTCTSTCSTQVLYPEDLLVGANAPASTAATEAATGKVVRFGTVQVRHYEVILGDNPHCKYPLGLGWRYNEATSASQDHPCPCQLTVDVFEEQRQERRLQQEHDRIQPRLYVAQDPASDKHNNDNNNTDHYLADVHIEADYDDTQSKLLPEMTLQERRTRLRAYGYSEAALRRAERQRIVALALEWKQGEPFAYHPKFVTQYAN